MKKLILSIFVIVASLSAFAQNETANLETNNAAISIEPDSSLYNHPDGYMMKEGIMMTVKNGVFTRMEKDVTLSNGTLVMRTGSYIKKGEKTQLIKEGEHLDLNGNLIPMSSSKYADKNKNLGTSPDNKKDTAKCIK